ncbi:hypothetical protein JCM19240_5709 [Vibrio maritimus]|uniref:Flavodoxin n=1 Tax=Vibrio maritimus TaxID=990268 RepID=A0A090SZA1_9VIBR|nr:hypothetical protein JCM19240_5709 [Vibrio maritimus]
MKDIATRLHNEKNQWLASQVEGGYPTKESLKGRDLYLGAITSCYLEPFEAPSGSATHIEWHLVDFHRLTIMFSLLHSKRWANDEHQQLIVEFLTQIIVEPSHALYVGFEQGEATAAAMVSTEGETVLISDIALSGDWNEVNVLTTIASLIQSAQIATNSQVWLEKR